MSNPFPDADPGRLTWEELQHLLETHYDLTPEAKIETLTVQLRASVESLFDATRQQIAVTVETDGLRHGGVVDKDLESGDYL